MKDVYVIKVKTRPPLSSLYPSERRYSASTVGGLSLVHFGLSILAFLLGTLAGSLQGPVLSFGCLFPFISGLLAWRRWYIDRNISIFFYGSLFSLIVSILCGVATVFDIAVMTETGIGSALNLEDVFGNPERFGRVEQFTGSRGNDTKGLKLDAEYDRKLYPDSELVNAWKDPLKIVENSSDSVRDQPKIPVRYFARVRTGFLSFWRQTPNPESRTNLLLDINVLVTCVLEVSWSLLSVKISLRGMRNQLADTRYDDCNDQSASKDCGLKIKRTKPRPPNPKSELNPYSRSGIDDGIPENLAYNSEMGNSVPRLPLPESNKEFRERVERFLANQAAHRIVEGSYS